MHRSVSFPSRLTESPPTPSRQEELASASSSRFEQGSGLTKSIEKQARDPAPLLLARGDRNHLVAGHLLLHTKSLTASLVTSHSNYRRPLRGAGRRAAHALGGGGGRVLRPWRVVRARSRARFRCRAYDLVEEALELPDLAGRDRGSKAARGRRRRQSTEDVARPGRSPELPLPWQTADASPCARWPARRAPSRAAPPTWRGSGPRAERDLEFAARRRFRRSSDRRALR